MMARPITMPLEAPVACRMRAAIKAWIEPAAIAAIDANTLIVRPTSATGRRP